MKALGFRLGELCEDFPGRRVAAADNRRSLKSSRLSLGKSGSRGRRGDHSRRHQRKRN